MILSLLIATFKSCSVSAFTCRFYIYFEWSIGYTCEFDSISYLDENAEFPIEGEHIFNLGDDDVWTLSTVNSNVSHLPKELFQKFVNISYLLVSDSRLESIDGAFAACHNFQVATFARNNLKHIESRAFEKCSNLFSLDFSDNKISIIPVDAFEGLAKLDRLILSNNPIKIVVPGVFNMLTGLWLLRMSDVDLPEIHPQLFSGLSEIRELEVGSRFPQDVFTLKTGTFKSLPYLNEIKIKNSNKGATQIEDGAFDDVRYLMYLDMSECALQRLDTKAFVKTPDLMYLNIRDNQISEIEGNFFTNLPKLAEVLADGNRCVNETFYIDSPFEAGFLQAFEECFTNYDDSTTTVEVETNSTIFTTPSSTVTTEETIDTTLGASSTAPSFLAIVGFVIYSIFSRTF